MLVLNTDAHAHDQIAGLMRYAIGTARRGGATPESILNTRDLPGLLSWLNRQHSPARFRQVTVWEKSGRGPE
jgi:histidinol phosphatase-like PHP family hydrolase